MKNRLTTLDIVCIIKELQESILGLRVDQVYDVDKKTYLIRLTKTDVKKVLVLESGCRFHTTTFEWPKNPAPSGFTMKLRKHLSNKRVEKISQLGADRIVDFQFGTETFAHHVLLELYDKGNIILTDCNYNILSLLRPRIQGEERLAAHERYAVEKAKQDFSLPQQDVEDLVKNNGGKTLREIFLSKVEFGPALFSHVLKRNDLAPSTKIPAGDGAEIFSKTVFQALEAGRLILENFKLVGGFIVQTPGGNKDKAQTSKVDGSNSEAPVFYDQFHPSVLLPDFQNAITIEFDTLNTAVDDFFSKIESQKLDMKQINQERDALKKLEKVKLDQLKRLEELKIGQETDKRKAELISVNQGLVDGTISAIRRLVANQIPWNEIWEQIQEAKDSGDPMASTIVKMNLIKNQFTMSLRDPYETPDEEPKTVIVEIDLGLSAYANATKYYDLKRQSAKKEERTLESQGKAFKSTEKKTMQVLKEVATIHSIKKARKVYWFEKFRWFITSENYLVLGGRDAQQNELLVKRYLRSRDVYLHADAHGAPTVIIKNDVQEQPILPKSLNEAGSFAVASSGSWESKVVTSSWWVWGDQVSKSAPTGEYLPTGSFMVRGKKNYLPPTQLVLGFGFLFRLTDESMEKHKNERPRRLLSESSVVDIREAKSNKLEVENEELQGEVDGSEFPDTQVKINLDSSSNRVQARTLSSMSVSSVNTFLSESTINEVDESQNAVIISSGVAPISVSAQKLRRDKKKADKKEKHEGVTKSTKTEKVEEQEEDDKDKDLPVQKPKRGQHGRNKKIKEKYRFQDEEDRAQRMLLLQGKGGDGASLGGKKGKGKNSSNVVPSPVKQKLPTREATGASSPKALPISAENKTEVEVPAPPEPILNSETTNQNDKNPPVEEPEEEDKDAKQKLQDLEEPEEEDKDAKQELQDLEEPEEEDKDAKQELQAQEEPEEEEEEGNQETETNLLNSLTGAPQEEDELLFAVPVVAPYATLQSYKFKIKMVPGSAKRGKAARSALEFFLRDKSANQREKDLLKSVKDQDLARNFPGKVKISTSHDKR